MTEKELILDMRMLIEDIREKVNNGQSVVLKGEGVSMLPFITSDDTLTLQKPYHTKAKVGEIYLYRRSDGSYAIHRVYAVKKDAVVMVGDAQLLVEKVPKSDLVAVVTKVQGPRQCVDCTAFSVRCRCVVRMKRRVWKYNCKINAKRAYHKVRWVLGTAKRLFTKER